MRTTALILGIAATVTLAGCGTADTPVAYAPSTSASSGPSSASPTETGSLSAATDTATPTPPVTTTAQPRTEAADADASESAERTAAPPTSEGPEQAGGSGRDVASDRPSASGDAELAGPVGQLGASCSTPGDTARSGQVALVCETTGGTATWTYHSGPDYPDDEVEYLKGVVVAVTEDIAEVECRMRDGIGVYGALSLLEGSYDRLAESAMVPPGAQAGQYVPRARTLRDFAELAMDEWDAGATIDASARFSVIQEETTPLLTTANTSLGTSYALYSISDC